MDDSRERQVAARIVRKYLNGLFFKAVMKGYNLMKFDGFYVGPGDIPPGDDDLAPMTVARIQGPVLHINAETTEDPANRGFPTHNQFRDISSTPELFSHAKKVIDRMRAIIDALPEQPRPLMSIDNLTQLQNLYREVEANAKGSFMRLFHSDVVRHTVNGLKTTYDIDIELVSDEGIKTVQWNSPIRGKSFSGCAGTAIEILNDIEKHGAADLDHSKREILAFCNNALLVMHENTLLIELERNAAEGRGAVSAMEDSLRQDMEEVFPKVSELENRYGAAIGRLPKARQIELFDHMRAHSTADDDLFDLSSELPGVRTSVGVTLDQALKDTKGPLRSWDAVRKTMTNPASGALDDIQFYIPFGGSEARANSSSLKCSALHSSYATCMYFLFVALNRAFKGGEHISPDVVTAYIRCVSRGVAEAAANTFRSSLMEDKRQDILDAVRDKTSKKNPEKIYDLTSYKKFVDNFARALSETVSELKELCKLADNCHAIPSAKHFPISDGWYCSVYLDPNELELRSVKLVHMKSDAPPDDNKYVRVYHPSVDFNTAGSQAVLAKKITEAVVRYTQEKNVQKLLDFFADKARVNSLREDMSAFVNDIKRKSMDTKERYYEVLQNDFPEDLMEEYVTNCQNV